MAGLFAILSALARVVWRDLRRLESITANNFFLFAFLLLPKSGVFLQVLLGLLLLFPLSADPLARIPRQRRGLWPLDSRQHLTLRLASLALSPVLWITIGMLIWAVRLSFAIQFLTLAVVIHVVSSWAARLSVRAPAINPMRHIPAFPGPLGGLIRKNLRELLSLLDPYSGLLLVLATVTYQLARGPLEHDARFGVTLMVVLAMSTSAQCLFALDSGAGFLRYRLLPMAGWQILAAKDAAFLLVLLPLILPLAPVPGIAAGFAALAIGHHSSVVHPVPQARWRFTGAASIVTKIFQVVVIFGAASLTDRVSPLVLPLCAVIWLMSVAIYGRRWDVAELV